MLLKHQELSRAGAAQKFAWGLADHSDDTTALHSATHLMLAGLRKSTWKSCSSSWFKYYLWKIEIWLYSWWKTNSWTTKRSRRFCKWCAAKMILEEMDKNVAKEAWVEGSFWEKYPDIVKVYTFKTDAGEIFFRELCGGPHIEATGNMGTFKIKKEEASSRWVRRIKVALEK